MAYQVTVEIMEDHVRFECRGARRPGREGADAIAVLARVAQACRDAGHALVLGVIDMRGPLPVAASFEIGDRPARYGWSRAFRLAIVDLSPAPRAHAFTLTVAHNRGYDAAVFGDEGAARAWLLAERET